MNLPLTGGCQCGALRYEVTEPPRLTYLCHCTDCQRITSGAFSVALLVMDSSFQITGGEPRLVGRIAASGKTATRWLCPDCGCWVCSAAWSAPSGTLRVVQGGSLDDKSWLRPTTHFWTRSKQPWVTIPTGDTVFETQPG